MTAPAVAGGAGYPCVACGRFAFPEADTTCFWCRQGAPAAAAHHQLTAPPKARTIEDVRAAANQKKHRCAGFMCIAQIDGDRLMCEPHMAVLPVWLQIKLEKAYSPRAANAWPQDLVEESIRFTMTDGQMAGLVDVANQAEMFSARAAVGGIGGKR